MPPNTTVFILGLALGICLLVIGLVLGYWLGRGSAARSETVDRQQFLGFLNSLTSWTSEFSGDVSRYQNELSDLNDQVRSGNALPREEITSLLSEIMKANERLQHRLDSAEERLENQTDQISSYLTEARTDALTGLPNRRAFDRATDEHFAGYQSHEQLFSLGLIDIDHFKQINDNFGHPAGDEVLKQIASSLAKELDIAECVARYGGEEFGFLSRNTAEQTAKALDRARLAASEIVVNHDQKRITVTLSGGVAQIQPSERIPQLLQRADEALYASKLGGRNRVHLHDGAICRLVTKVPVEETQVDPSRLSPEESRQQNTAKSKIQERLQRIVLEESKRVTER